MTLPYERRWAVDTTRQFLVDLQSDLSAPEAVRKEASRCLKHYPGDYYMDMAAELAPAVFGDWEDMKHE